MERYAFARWLLQALADQGRTRRDLSDLAHISLGAAYGHTAVEVPSATVPDRDGALALLRALGHEGDEVAWNAWATAQRALAAASAAA